MQTQIKRYNIQLKGKVQHIGYRGIIESNARKLDIKGYVFNDTDGSVKIACEGIQKSLDLFINNLKDFARADLDSIEKNEIQEDLYLPNVFSRVATDDYYEFGKKFDVGIDFLSDIKTDTKEMKTDIREMKTDTKEMKTDIREMKTDTKEMKTDIREMKTDTKEMKTDIREMKTDTKEMKTDIREMKTDTKEMKTDIREMKTDTREMKKSLAKLNTTLETFITKQDEHSIKQDEHNRYLEKILDKLVVK